MLREAALLLRALQHRWKIFFRTSLVASVLWTIFFSFPETNTGSLLRPEIHMCETAKDRSLGITVVQSLHRVRLEPMQNQKIDTKKHLTSLNTQTAQNEHLHFCRHNQTIRHPHSGIFCCDCMHGLITSFEFLLHIFKNYIFPLRWIIYQDNRIATRY